MDGVSEREVLEHILDGSMKPTDIELSLLKDMTNKFSEDLKIGQGGFGTVYKGFLGNRTVAVKRIINCHTFDDKLFRRMVNNLIDVDHENVVRFLGFCCNTEETLMPLNGRQVYVERRERLLCLEYIGNGSLDKYITDELQGLEWNIRYRIINGIFEGLHYLHKEKGIIHMDLKPENILIDDHMVPKITDFGLSRLEDSQTTSTPHFLTIGYCAPEYQFHGKMSLKSDMYSLGVIIVELVTGQKGIPNINNVLRRWRHRWNKSARATPLECKQVSKCIEIGLLCMNEDPFERPFIWDIIEDVRKMECSDGHVISDEKSIVGQPIEVQPHELRFPFMAIDGMSVSVAIKAINTTDDYLALNPCYGAHNVAEYYTCPEGAILAPRSTQTLVIRRTAKKDVPQSIECNDKYFILSTAVSKDFDITSLEKFYKETREDPKWHEIELGVVLAAVYDGMNKIVPDIPNIRGIDIHPTEPRMLITRYSVSHIYILNYHTEEMTEVLVGPHHVRDAKFIASKQWIVAGDEEGDIYVYGYDPINKIRVLKEHEFGIWFLAVHSTEPYMLSTCEAGKIVLWDIGKDWRVKKTFQGDAYIDYSAFGPKDSDIFASTDNSRFAIKIRNLHSGECMVELSGHSDYPSCFDFFSHGDELFMITGSEDETAKIWDCVTGACVQTLRGHTRWVTSVCCHPDLPLLITGSVDGTVCLWNSTNFSLERVLNFDLGHVDTVACLKGTTRIAILHESKLVLADIGPEEPCAC